MTLGEWWIRWYRRILTEQAYTELKEVIDRIKEDAKEEN